MIKTMIIGASGRMGQATVKAVLEDSELELVAAVDHKDIGKDAGEMVGLKKSLVPIEQDLAKTIEKTKPMVAIDFTSPKSVFQNTKTLLQHQVAPVIGTTGLKEEEYREIEELSKIHNTPVFIAPNFAIGAVLMMTLATKAAKYLPQVEIIERHHDQKLDAPSGTAIQTAKMIREVRGDFPQGHVDEKENLAGARGADIGGIHIHSVRLPGYVAHQEVVLGGRGETLTIRHDSLNRESFMPGVLLACKKVLGLKGLTIGLDKIM